MSKNKTRGPGRPPKTGDKAMMISLTVRFPEPMNAEIEAIQASRPMEQPDKGQVVRELIAEALEARAKAAKRK